MLKPCKPHRTKPVLDNSASCGAIRRMEVDILQFAVKPAVWLMRTLRLTTGSVFH